MSTGNNKQEAQLIKLGLQLPN